MKVITCGFSCLVFFLFAVGFNNQSQAGEGCNSVKAPVKIEQQSLILLEEIEEESGAEHQCPIQFEPKGNIVLVDSVNEFVKAVKSSQSDDVILIKSGWHDFNQNRNKVRVRIDCKVAVCGFSEQHHYDGHKIKWKKGNGRDGYHFYCEIDNHSRILAVLDGVDVILEKNASFDEIAFSNNSIVAVDRHFSGEPILIIYTECITLPYYQRFNFYSEFKFDQKSFFHDSAKLLKRASIY